MCRMPKQLRSCVNRKEPQTEAETDLKQIIIRPRQLFIITFCLCCLLRRSLAIWIICCCGSFADCVVLWGLFLGDYISLSLRPQHAITCQKRNQCHRPHSFSISSADTLQPRPHFRKFSACVCACVYSFSYLFSFFQRFVLRFTCRKSHKIH